MGSSIHADWRLAPITHVLGGIGAIARQRHRA